MRDIPNFTRKLNTNEACSAFFAAPRVKFSICNHAKICTQARVVGIDIQTISLSLIFEAFKSAPKTM